MTHATTTTPDRYQQQREFGPDGGGQIVAEGSPEQVAAVPKSFPGAYLAHVHGVPAAKAS